MDQQDVPMSAAAATTTEQQQPAQYQQAAGGHNRRTGATGFSVLCKNIPAEVMEQEMTDIFSEFGVVLDVYLPKDVYTRGRKGFGFVEFESLDSAHAAVEKMHGYVLRKNTLICEMAKHQRKSRGEMMDQDRRGPPRHHHRRRSPPPRHYRRGGRSPSPPPRRNRKRSPSAGGSAPAAQQQRNRSPRRGSSPPPAASGRRSSPPARGSRGRSPRH